MKKLLILVLIALLLTLSIFIVIQGVHIGSLEILGVKGIQEKSSQLDEKIQQAGKLAEKDYQQALNDVKTNTKKLQEEKKNYEDMTQISEDGDVQAANQIEKYEIETLKLFEKELEKIIMHQPDYKVIKIFNENKDIVVANIVNEVISIYKGKGK